MHYDSDLDILVDFDDVGVGAALDFVETECARLGLIADVQPKSLVQGRIHRQDGARVVGDIVSDARWFEVDLDIDRANPQPVIASIQQNRTPRQEVQ